MHRADQDQRVGVAALVLPNVRGDREKALQRVEAHARRAAALGAKIVVAPEACLDGYCCHESGLTKEAFSRLAEPEDGRSLVRLGKLARELDLYLCVGFTEIDKGELYNAAILLGPDGRTAGKYRKTHGVEELYKPGDELPVFDTRYGKVGILICFDRQLPESARTLADRGARLILIPSNGMWGRMNDAMLRARAYDNGVFIVFAHPRDGLVIDPGGRIIAANMSVPGQVVGLPTDVDTEDAGGWPEAVTREIDLEAWQSARGTLLRRRLDLYSKSATPAR
jgi:predicted amidohydrolase